MAFLDFFLGLFKRKNDSSSNTTPPTTNTPVKQPTATAVEDVAVVVVEDVVEDVVEVEAATQHTDIMEDHSDICDEMVFHATCQLRTPLAVFKKEGEVFKGDAVPPTYGEPEDGAWLPKMSNDGRTCASDAGIVDPAQYINYAVGLLTIFESDAPISEKMNVALAYANTDSLKHIENLILSHYGAENIADVMSRFCAKSDCIEYYFDKPHKLDLIDGVNKKVASALEEAGTFTIKALSELNESDLIKIKGIGKISAAKILNSFTK